MYKLIVSIVPHNSGEFIMNSAKLAGASGGTILMGRGTAANSIVQLLGFGDTSKDIVYIVVDECLSGKVCRQIEEDAREKKAHFGVLFTVSVGSFMRSGCKPDFSENGGNKIMDENSYQMINVIVNKGYAEDAMAAARKAGAGGGTIISARGTAREGDEKFFGMEIVPEKDMLIILVPEDKAQAVVSAIQELSCLSKPGSGVVFCNRAESFTLLGKTK